MPDTRPDLIRLLHRLDGVATTAELRARGVADARMRRALARGELVRVRRGVYALPHAPIEVVRAARVGGRVGGAAALRLHGVWSPWPPRPVVEVHAGARILREPDDDARPFSGGVEVRWREVTGRRVGVAPLPDAVRLAVLRCSRPEAVAILDSVLHQRLATSAEVRAWLAPLPRATRRLLRLCDARADGGTETVLRVALLLAGIPAEPRAPFPGEPDRRVDLLIRDRLVIEIDSEAHHGTAEHRRADLRRDAALAALGLIVLRFDWRQITYDLDDVVQIIGGYVERGLHLSAVIA